MTATTLIQLDNGSPQHRACRAWATVSSTTVTQIVVTASAASAQAVRDAKTLHDLLQLAMRNSGARAESPRCGGDFGPGVGGCWASGNSGPVRRLLVWVSDDLCSPPPFAVNVLPWDRILTLLPPHAPAARLPSPASAHVAVWYQPGAVAAKVPDVLLAAGISSDAFSIFISYRWDDAQGVAEQLFDALAQEQFDVYLDRFRTPPGTNFLERIRYELADKACVVILDSRDVLNSAWVQGEHAFARLYRLGLMAIDLPGGSRSFPGIRRRFDATGGAPAGSFARSTRLSAGTMDQAVAFIRDRHLSETSRRHRYQRRIIREAARAAGLAATLRPDGMFDASSGRGYVIGASARPPRASSFRRACEAAAPSGAKPVIVGPLQAQLHGGRQDTDWLARTSGSAAVDERRLYKAALAIAAGRL